MASVIGTTELARTFLHGKKKIWKRMTNIYKKSDTEKMDMNSLQPL